MPNVLAIYSGFKPPNKKEAGACEIYRLNMPLVHMGKTKTWITAWSYLDDLLMNGENAFVQYLHQFDVIVLARRFILPGNEVWEDRFFTLLRSNGAKIIYETDDDITNIYRNVIAGDALYTARKCDALTVTTPYLGEWMQQHTGRPYYVLPNMLEPTVWRKGNFERTGWKDGLTIWLSGSETHYNDWKVLEGVIPEIMAKHPKAHFLIAGFLPDYLKKIENVHLIKGMPYVQYAQCVRQSDIILAPVDPDDKFNDGKSPIKATEGQGAVRKMGQNRFSGAAVIATDNKVYRLAVKDGYNGLLAKHTPEGWFEAIDKVLSDEPLRLSLQANAYKEVWSRGGKWDISKQWTQWAKAYREIIKDEAARAAS